MVLSYNKEWWKSKTVWAAVFTAIVATVAVALGDGDPIVAALIAVGSIFGIYGRVTATSKLK